MSTTTILRQEVEGDAIGKRVFMRFVPLLVVCWVFAYLDRVNISFAKLQMQADLGFSDTVYGLGASLFFIGYFLFEVPSNMILHKVGARVWITRIMISWGIASSCMHFVNSEFWFYVLRFLIGTFEAGFVPGALYFFTKWFPSKQRAQINTIFMSGIAFCGIIGGPISGGIMKYFDGLMGLPGWQWLFLVEGIPCVFLGIFIWLFLDDEIEHAKWLSPAEKKIWSDKINSESQNAKAHNFREALKEPAIYMLSFIYLLLAGSLYGLVFWMPQLIKSAGTQDTFVIGIISALPYLAATIAMIVLGKTSDKYRERRWHLGGVAVIGGIGYIICATNSTNTSMLLVGLVLVAVGIISSIGLFWIFPQHFLTGMAAAAGIAMINSVGQLGGVITPYMIGKVIDLTGSPIIGLYALAVASFVAFILIGWGLPKRFYERF